MKLFAGLGNPGRKYAANRHNIGFMALDAIADANSFGSWREKFQADMCEGRLGGDKVILLKPLTFMNLSGQSVGDAIRYLKLEPEDVWVFHDELDLSPGKYKLKTGGGHAGHNGLRSLHQHIGADYNRVRIGIGHPGHKNMVSNYVLQDFAKSDHEWIDPLLAAIGREAGRLAGGDAPGFTNAVALALRPPELPRPAKQPQPSSTPNEPPQNTQDNAESKPKGPLERLLARFSR